MKQRHYGNPLLCLFAIGFVACPTPCEAAIVYFAGQEIPIPNTYAGVSVNLETGSNDTVLAGVAGGAVNLYFGGESFSNDADQTAGSPIFQPIRTGTANTDSPQNMAVNDVVDSSANVPANLYGVGFGGSDGHIGTQFTAGTPGYIGFSLELANNDLVYGWMRVTLQDDGVTPGLIHEWAYEDTPNTGIEVGAIPEPSGVLLLVTGLTTLALRRRR